MTSFFDRLPALSKDKLQKLIDSPSKAALEDAVHDDHILSALQTYLTFKHNARTGELGLMGQFWISYSDEIWLCPIADLEGCLKLGLISPPITTKFSWAIIFLKIWILRVNKMNRTDPHQGGAW